MGIFYSRGGSAWSQGKGVGAEHRLAEKPPGRPAKARAERLVVLRDSSLTSLPHDQTSLGKKITDWVHPEDKSGEFKRQASSFRDSVSNQPGAKFPLEKGRYHLYVSYACPWVCCPPFLHPLGRFATPTHAACCFVVCCSARPHPRSR